MFFPDLGKNLSVRTCSVRVCFGVFLAKALAGALLVTQIAMECLECDPRSGGSDCIVQDSRSGGCDGGSDCLVQDSRSGGSDCLVQDSRSGGHDCLVQDFGSGGSHSTPVPGKKKRQGKSGWVAYNKKRKEIGIRPDAIKKSARALVSTTPAVAVTTVKPERDQVAVSEEAKKKRQGRQGKSGWVAYNKTRKETGIRPDAIKKSARALVSKSRLLDTCSWI